MTLTSRTVRRTSLLGAAALAVTALTGCGAGFGAQTLQPYQAAEGTNAQSGEILARNVLVLADAEGKGELNGAFLNDGAKNDYLTKVELDPSHQGIEITGMRAFTLRPGALLTLPPAGGKPIVIDGVKPGTMLKMTFTFGVAGPITTQVPVLPEDHYSPTPPTETPDEHHG
ncbi:hypothetical protein [Kribbella deserti]|uniref:Copper chaperone PCu(A)C n=1 Tax=Kribbella deserti TaxID=1926257 RepID=A0ABV6QFV6_9ACTN